MKKPSEIAGQRPSSSRNGEGGPTSLEDVCAVVCRECRQEVLVTKRCPLCGHLACDHDPPRGNMVSKGVFCRYYEECHCALHPDSFIQHYEGRAFYPTFEAVPWFKDGPLLRLDAVKAWSYDRRDRPDKKYLVNDWHAPEETAEVITAKSGSEALEQYRALHGWISKRDSNVKLLREGDKIVAGKIVRKVTDKLNAPIQVNA